MTIDKIFNLYIETKQSLVSEQTYRSYVSSYNTHILPRFGQSLISDLRYIDFQIFSNDLLALGKSPKTLKNIFVVIKGIYSFAKKNDWYSGQDYASMVEFPKYDNKYYIKLSPNLQKRYLMALLTFDEPIYKDIFLFLFHGRRLGEVLDLKWEYLDLNQGIVYYPSTHYKSRKNISFALTETLVERLKEYQSVAIDQQGTVFVTGYVFKNPNTGTRYRDLKKVWIRLLEKNNLDYIKIHAIRHLLGTYLINELKKPIQDVSFMLGHSDITITQKYVHAKPTIAKNVTQSLMDSFKTRGEREVENISNVLKLGESFQAVLFSVKETLEVDKT